MDVCLNSLLPKDKKILIINNGDYSSRAAEICRAYGLSHVELTFPADRLPELGTITRTLEEDPDIKLVYTTHQETGSGLLNPIQEIGHIVHRHQGVFIVDTTSTYAMLPIDMEDSEIDFCMASAQKGIMAMTGLSFIIGKKALLEESAHYPVRSYYCNLFMQYDAFKRSGQMRFTPPVQTIYAAIQGVKEYWQEGEAAKWERHKRTGDAIYHGVLNLGFQCFLPRELQSGLVVTVNYPDNPEWDFEQIHDFCYSKGYTIYPGKVNIERTFRLCSLGAIDERDIKRFFDIFTEALKRYGLYNKIYYK
jgi:2-aminoethylphosphonate-pyruvate transaminase